MLREPLIERIRLDSSAFEVGMRVAVLGFAPLVSSKLLRSLRISVSVSLLGLTGCGASAGKLEPGSDAGALEVCDGQTLAELEQAKTISDDCKTTLATYLPAPFDDFGDRVLVLGQETLDDGSRRVFVAGLAADGTPLSNDVLAAATVAPQASATAGAASPVTVTPFGDLSEDALSLELVNDYSASMSIPDLKVVQHIEDDLLGALPPIVEGEVTLFSTDVRVKQPFTTDHDALVAGVECDESFDRELTALYDGVGNGLQSLTSRSRPARVLLVSTDGLENASVAYKKSDIVKGVAQDHVFVVVLGALFANLDELETLAGPNGVYFYTPLYADMRAQVSNLVTALAHGAAVDIPPAVAAEPLVLRIGDASVALD